MFLTFDEQRNCITGGSFFLQVVKRHAIHTYMRARIQPSTSKLLSKLLWGVSLVLAWQQGQGDTRIGAAMMKYVRNVTCVLCNVVPNTIIIFKKVC
jgi:hypothetical protein